MMPLTFSWPFSAPSRIIFPIIKQLFPNVKTLPLLCVYLCAHCVHPYE
jgi:hypothetical protein